MTELDNIRKEAQKATELDMPQDRAKAYRAVLSSAINYNATQPLDSKRIKGLLLSRHTPQIGRVTAF